MLKSGRVSVCWGVSLFINACVCVLECQFVHGFMCPCVRVSLNPTPSLSNLFSLNFLLKLVSPFLSFAPFPPFDENVRNETAEYWFNRLSACLVKPVADSLDLLTACKLVSLLMLTLLLLSLHNRGISL